MTVKQLIKTLSMLDPNLRVGDLNRKGKQIDVIQVVVYDNIVVIETDNNIDITYLKEPKP